MKRFLLIDIRLIEMERVVIEKMKKKAVAIACCLLIMSASVSGQTTAEVRAELRRQQVPCAEIVLAQARLETGNFTSKLCKTKHNIFGIKHGGRYASYRRWQDCITDYKKCISSRYHGGDYYAFLKRIGYASDRQYLAKVRQIAKGGMS